MPSYLSNLWLRAFYHTSFQRDKQHRFIWKPLSCQECHRWCISLNFFYVENIFYVARVDLFPPEWKHSRSATLRNWRVSCWSERLTDCTQLVRYVFSICLYVRFLTNKVEASITLHPSTSRLTPCCPTQVHRCLATLLLLSSPSVLRQQVHMSLSAGREQGIQAWTWGTSTPPQGRRGHPQTSRARSGWASRWVE